MIRLALLAEGEHPKTHQWCEGLAGAGAEIHVLSLRGEPCASARFYRLQTFGLQGRSAYLAAVPSVRRLLRQIRPDVVVAYSVTAYGLMGTLSGIHPVVQVTSGSDVLLAPRTPVIRRVVKFNLQHADLVTAWAPHMAAAAERLGARREQIFTLPRGIPFKRFAAVRCRAPVAGDVLRIISTRFLERLYRVDRVIDAVAILHAKGVETRLTIAGDGSEAPLLRHRVRTAGLDHCVRFLGRVRNSHLPQVLAENDVYVALAESDGVSASLLEAMAVGLFPVVHDNLANQAWVRRDINGLLISDTRPERLVEAFLTAHRNVSLRASARSANPELVHARGDLERHSPVYVERFAALRSQFEHRFV